MLRGFRGDGNKFRGTPAAGIRENLALGSAYLTFMVHLKQ